MRFVTIAELNDQTFMITARSAGQAIRFNGNTAVTPVDGAVIRLRGTGVVELGEGYWTRVLIADGRYQGPYFDGDSGEGEATRYRWVGTERESQSVMEQRFPLYRSETDEEYLPKVEPLRRIIRGVGTLSGSVVTQEFNRKDAFGQIVEFTLGAEDPGVYGLTKSITLQPTTPYLVQDEAYNLVPRPSAEAAGSNIVIARNYSKNPSVEVDATDWSFRYASSAPGNATVTSGRTTELAAEGSASYRVRVLADGGSPENTGLSSAIYVQHTIDITGLAENRFFVSVWAAGIVAAGIASFGQLGASVRYFDAANNLLFVGGFAPDAPSSEYAGHVFTGGTTAPENAVKAVLEVYFQATFTRSPDPARNADVRMYVDAVVFAIQ